MLAFPLDLFWGIRTSDLMHLQICGPTHGGATVYTKTRAGYGSKCPHVCSFIRMLRLNLDLESALMRTILNDGMDLAEAAGQWLRSEASMRAPWVDGVTPFDGMPGLDALKANLSTR